MYQEMEPTVDPKYAFATAFWAGLAAPAGLYSPAPSYLSYVTLRPIGYDLFAVGSGMTQAFQAIESIAGHGEQS